MEHEVKILVLQINKSGDVRCKSAVREAQGHNTCKPWPPFQSSIYA
jgi:hypothetical protein